MLLRKPIFTIIIAFFLAILLIVATFILESRQGIENNENMNIVVQDQPFNKQLDSQIRELNLKSQTEAYKRRGFGNIAEHNKVLFAIDNFFELLYMDMYEEAYKLLNSDFAKTKDIKNINEFKEYVNRRRMNNMTCDILKADKGNKSNQYIVHAISLERSGGQKYSSEQEFNNYLSSTFPTEIITVTFGDNQYTLSFEGYVESVAFKNQKLNNEIISIQLDSVDIYSDYSILHITIINNGSNGINVGNLFFNILAKDQNNTLHWAEHPPNSIDYELLEKQSKNIPVKIPHLHDTINVITFNFNDDYNPMSFEL
ncbi:MAG: hypothetical protein AB7G87_04950 [Clostridia bacterium]